MDFLSSIKDQIPDYAKDIRLNIDAVIARSSLPAEDALGCALAAAFAAKSKPIIDVLKANTPEAEGNAALTAAALMGMNNAWYPYIEMAGDDELKTVRAELRMNAYATSGGVEKKKFEAYALAASIVGKCHFCVKSHYDLLKKEGYSTQQLRDIGRIAAVVNAASQVLAAQ
ncbi:carboxymuconolactone decarboxylase family protein [Schlegelella sp. S2-27]|uniref:Alkyl hydroperoxide reductase AhpD n=1 Tax=Caldimonas mangrovi TaxID=2944811 RepID=A0ABT0YNA4_9BURK|nr:carboxymuconolactone decarboxylase family protein [Caldimonas mangrovi]MCM5680190.1 carboxymuconolactone decarboxylase family protein [Caldimonas mangrovi]